MKHQYVRDINDYRKYALLRALSANGTNRIGVCWMLTPSDGSMDGNKLSYLAKPGQHRHFDPELFDILAHAAAEPDRRRLQTIEDSGAIPGATYFNDILPDDARGRQAFFESCADRLEIPIWCSSTQTTGWKSRCPRAARTHRNTYTLMKRQPSMRWENRC